VTELTHVDIRHFAPVVQLVVLAALEISRPVELGGSHVLGNRYSFEQRVKIVERYAELLRLTESKEYSETARDLIAKLILPPGSSRYGRFPGDASRE